VVQGYYQQSASEKTDSRELRDCLHAASLLEEVVEQTPPQALWMRSVHSFSSDMATPSSRSLNDGCDVDSGMMMSHTLSRSACQARIGGIT
jgi:hypothetical protein